MHTEDIESLLTNADRSTNTKQILLVVNKFAQKQKKNMRSDLKPFHEQKFSNPRPFLSTSFPKTFQKYKTFGLWTMGNGGQIDVLTE